MLPCLAPLPTEPAESTRCEPSMEMLDDASKESSACCSKWLICCLMRCCLSNLPGEPSGRGAAAAGCPPLAVG